MTTAGAVYDVPDTMPPREWWQLWAEWRARWWERHPTLRRRLALGRTVGLWLGLFYLLVVVVAWPELLLGMRAWVGACLGAVVWFFLARTKTLTWSGFFRFFAVCGLWSVGVALVLAVVSSTLGNAGVEALGPTVFVAGLGEEALKLMPLVVLAVAAPRRVSRFAAVDWWLLGLASGLAFEAVEEGARRVFLLAEMQRQGLLVEYQELYGGSVPEGWTTFGLLPSDRFHEGAGFAGHAVATGMVAALVGLGVVVWRRARGRGAAGWAWRAVVVVVPVVCLVTMMADHLVFNAHHDEQVVAGDGAWLDPDVTAVPWWLRVPWSVFGHGHWRPVWFVVLFVVCLVVDGYRLGARPASSLAGQPVGGRLGAVVVRLWVRPGWWARVWAVGCTAVLATGWVVVRDLGQVAGAHVRGAGEPVRVVMRRGAVAASTARGLREAAMDHAAGPVRPARTRLVGLVVGAGLLAVALLLAPHLAAGTGEGLLRPDFDGWLPGVLTQLSEYWNGLPLAKQVALGLALGAMFALWMGPVGWGVAGVLTWGLAHGAGVVTFARDPRAATVDYLVNLTPAQAGADLLDVVLTFAPANFAAGGRALARNAAHQATTDPVAVVTTRRQLMDHGLPAHPATPARPTVPAHPDHADQIPTHPGPPTTPHPTAPGPGHPPAPAASPTHPPATARSGPAPTSPTPGPSWSQAGPTPPPGGQWTVPGAQTPGAVHPSTGLPAHPPTGPGHPPAGTAHPPVPTSPHPQPGAQQPRPPTRPDLPGPATAPRPAGDAGPAGRPTAGDLPDSARPPRPTGPDAPTGPSRATDLPSHPDGPGTAARPDPAPVPGRAADHVTTQKIPDLPRPGAPGTAPAATVHATPEAAAAASRASGGAPPARPGQTGTGPGRPTTEPRTPQPARNDLPAHTDTPSPARPAEPAGAGAGSHGGNQDGGSSRGGRGGDGGEGHNRRSDSPGEDGDPAHQNRPNDRDPQHKPSANDGNGTVLEPVGGGEPLTQPTGERGGTPTGQPESPGASASTDNVRAIQRQNEAADTLARMGHDVEHQPTVLPTDRGVDPNKNPDYRIEGKIFDGYSPQQDTPARSAYATIRDKVDDHQAPRILVNLDDSLLDVADLRQWLVEHPIQGLEEVLVVRSDTVQQIFP